MPIITLIRDPTYTREISLEACRLSDLLVDLLGEEDGDAELPLDNVDPAVMDKVLVFLEYHKSNPMAAIAKPITTNVVKDIVGEWDADYIDLMGNQELLMDLILAANYLNCTSLLDLGILKIASEVKDKEPDDIKTAFHIDKDVTPEEERQVREQNLWVFELGEKVAQQEAA